MNEVPPTSVETRRPFGAVRWTAALLVVGWMMGTGLWTAIALPWTKGPDEGDHFEYVYFIQQHRALPDPRRDAVLESHHPPLAYALYAVVLEGLIAADERIPADAFSHRHWRRMLGRETTFIPDETLASQLDIDLEEVRRLEAENDGSSSPPRLALRILELRSWALYCLRLPAVLLGAWTLLILLATLRHLFPRGPNLALALFAAIGTLPSYAFTFATVSNDPLVCWLGAIAVWRIVRAYRAGRLLETGPLVLVSVVLGLALLTKLHALGVAAFCAITVLRAPGRAGERLRALGILVAGPLLIAGWWHVRQTILQGSPIATQNHADFRPEFFRLGEHHPSLLIDFVSSMINSFFGRFGNDTLVLPPLYYFPLEGAVAVALLGLVAFRRRQETWPFEDAGEFRLPLAGAALGVAFVVLNLVRLDFDYNAHSGRYLMPLVGLLAIGVAAGFARTLGRRSVALLAAIAIWNLVFGGLFYGVVLRNAYSVSADKVARGRVVAYYDCGHDLFDQPTAGGNVLAQRFGMWTLPAHTMRLARQAPGHPALIYRTEIPDPTRSYQVRVRYPSMKGIDGSDIPDPYAIELLANDRILHGPMSIWGEFGELRYPVPAEALADRDRLDIWWENRFPRNPLVAVTELWVEESWLQLEDARWMDDASGRVRVLVRNVDHHGDREARLFARRGAETLTAAARVTVPALGVTEVEMDLGPEAGAKRDGLEIKLVDPELSPWSQTKLRNWAIVPPAKAGSLAVPDVSVLRHRNLADRETPIAVARYEAAPAGRFRVLLSHLESQSPVERGEVRLELEGARLLGPAEPDGIPGFPGLRRSGWRVEFDGGALGIGVIATRENPGETYDLDRLWIVPEIDAAAPGPARAIRP
ncbi:MAG: hypothetical protein R3F20_00515 [Planctomycetota bacterium]